MDRSWLRTVILVATFAYINFVAAYSDVPCDAVPVSNRSVICRCNATYCDTLVRELPADGELVTYTSSDSGLRFHKESYNFELAENSSDSDYIIFDLDPETKYQSIDGFGGAITDAAGINWQNLTDPQLKQHLINSYCSDVGIQYSMMRMPIGGTDFSTRTYAYNEYPLEDKDLSNFSLSYEDYAYKLPFIKACMEVAPEEIHVLGTCWSPPTWMKVLHNFTGVNFLRPMYYQTYADYHLKFVDECVKEGIPIWGLTTGNEPIINLANLGPLNTIGWTVTGMADWIADYFGPTLKKHYPDIKLLGVDDQRPLIPLWLNMAAGQRSEMIDYLDGVAVHFYMNNYDTPDTIPLTLKDYPNLFALSTEAAFGVATSGAEPVDWGSWDRAASYAKDIIENLNVNVIGWIDWNMVLNSEGGPAWNSNFCDSPIIVKPEEGAFYKQPMFYSMGHFAKFLTRGSQRIKLTASETSATVYSVAALTPGNTVVVVWNNWESYEVKAALRISDKAVKITLPPRSIVTSEFTL